MELDDLKEAWQDQKLDASEAPDVQKIIDMLQNKNYGPIASLKGKFNRSAIIGACTWIALLTYITLQKGGWEAYWERLSSNNNGILYVLVPMIILAITIAIFQYAIVRVLSDLRNIKNPVKSEIQSKVLKMSKLFNWQRWITVIACTIYLVGVEIAFHNAPTNYMRDIPQWFSLNIAIRILGYIGYIVLLVFISKYTYQRQYGKHVDYLKDLANQLQ